MPGKKKKFIDKKNAVTFYLGHRSQRDPLAADENAPQRVLIPMDQMPSTSTTTSSKSNAENNTKVDATKRKDEQLKYGIYFDDDYDYLQHLKDSREVSNIEWDICERLKAPAKKSEPAPKSDSKDFKLKLPSSVFQSDYEESVGLLNKAAPIHGFRPDLDSDVIAALDDDFDYNDPDNELEDNFMELANSGEGELKEGELNPEDVEGLFSSDDEDYEDEEDEDDECMSGDEDKDSVGSLEGPQYTFADEETKSRFTNYSMSSSVVRRNEGLTLVDDRFEKMYEDYEDTEIGALDLDEIEGHLKSDSDMLLKIAKEFEDDQKREEGLNEKITKLVLQSQMEEESDEDTLTESEDEPEKEKWDCESILSTYSTTKNRPKIIKETSNRIRVSGKTGMPIGVLGKGLTKANLKDLDSKYEEEFEERPTKSLISSVSVRNKNETPEERLERKKMVKEIRRERRIERKANTGAFKDEKKRQEKIRLNNKANLQGLKL